MISEATREKMRRSAHARNNGPRLAAIPKGERHWNWNEKPSLLALHRRIHRKHGPASAHKCVDCESQAKDWSLEASEYSDRIEDYRPRCRKCHIRKDGNNRNGVHVWHALVRGKDGKFLPAKP